jgi:hypothetical protein
MGKAERIRRTSAREKIVAQQAAARRAEARKRMLTAVGSVVGVLAIVVALIVIKTASNGSAATGGAAAAQSQANAVSKQIETVPASTLNSVGAGTVSKMISTSGQSALTSGGKPQIVFMGEESCPYCAAERWAMVVALSRFGTFSNLSYIHSSSTDVYPNTPTLTFYKSSYTSKYVDFNPVEMYTVKGTTLMKPTTAETALMTKYDAPPYVQSADSGSFPFLDIGNQYLVVGSQYLPSSLAKLTWAQVAADIRNPSSPVAKDVDGAANSITAAICKIAKTAPAGVCTSAGVTAAAGSL